MLRYYWFRIRWLYQHRYWSDSRQKWKRMEKDWEQECRERGWSYE